MTFKISIFAYTDINPEQSLSLSVDFRKCLVRKVGKQAIDTEVMDAIAHELRKVRKARRQIIDPIFFNITHYEHDAPPSTPLRFHAQWRREELTQPNVPYTILKAQGDGRYIGCRLDMQNRQWWLKFPIGAAVFPYGFGFGMLEGPEQIWVDGESEPSVSGTGTEDYFNTSWCPKVIYNQYLITNVL